MRGQMSEMPDSKGYVGKLYLKGARFATPSSESDETKAIGRGTMPLIISVYYMRRVSRQIRSPFALANTYDFPIDTKDD